MLTNLDAEVSNDGVEITLNGLIVNNNDFTFSLGGNVSFIKNMLNNFDGIVETGDCLDYTPPFCFSSFIIILAF